jgi:hypothetical protein
MVQFAVPLEVQRDALLVLHGAVQSAATSLSATTHGLGIAQGTSGGTSLRQDR